MNANELADELENGAQKAEDHATIAKRVKKAATMLRQQQAEIESLKAKTLTDDPLVNFKPVWIEKPELTLTDEEIMALAVENGAWKSKESGNVYPDDLELLDFARAILRKAQEK